ncbi:MAG TPA: sulfur transferase domain-containing protein [Hyphomicrobiaceae bacterium]|nr:sulfur transferase domain-containing protein [Hyphomicrobiaceae bacterium]
MKPAVVSDVLAVGEVPALEQIAILAKAGFKTLINNQPDGEVDRLPASATVGAEAQRLGLVYRYIPLASRTPPPEQLAAFAAALKELPAPIYACCYSGARSAAGCALILARQSDVDGILAGFAKAGYDVSGIRAFLEKERSGDKVAKPHANGSAEHSKTATPTATPLPPSYQPVVVLPRASSSGGFAM